MPRARPILARQYSSNVVTLYSPNATWSKVEPALKGASIVVYFGHGNGWPSPYKPFQENTKDGLGLNATAGAGNANVKYYGANYLEKYVKLAPNAVVILGHLCYSAGNSEGGQPAPTLAVAEERVDNMGAGWLQTGARAVISEPYSNEAGWYIEGLFTTHQSINALWQSALNFNHNVQSWTSVRNTWATVQLDTNTARDQQRALQPGDQRRHDPGHRRGRRHADPVAVRPGHPDRTRRAAAGHQRLDPAEGRRAAALIARAQPR